MVFDDIGDYNIIEAVMAKQNRDDPELIRREGTAFQHVRENERILYSAHTACLSQAQARAWSWSFSHDHSYMTLVIQRSVSSDIEESKHQ